MIENQTKLEKSKKKIITNSFLKKFILKNLFLNFLRLSLNFFHLKEKLKAEIIYNIMK